jgi:hypothetical protein
MRQVVAGASDGMMVRASVPPFRSLRRDRRRPLPSLAAADGAAELERGLDILLTGLTATLPARPG